MPRQARIDASGALHHIMVRGIEHKKICKDNKDKDNFLQGLGNIIEGYLHILLYVVVAPQSRSSSLYNRSLSNSDCYAKTSHGIC